MQYSDMEDIKRFLQFIQKSGYYPPNYIVESAPSDPEVLIGGKKYLVFCSNNYYGLANDPIVKEAAKQAIDQYGVGSGGPRLIGGNAEIQEILEEKLANFKHTEDAITFVAGYMANLGIIRAVMDIPLSKFLDLKFFKKAGVIFSDELNHSSIIDGCKLSKAKIVVYKHKDVQDLRSKLQSFRKEKKMIITDGVFSLEGDIAPLPEIVELAHKHKALLMVDDAHGTGVLGTTGRGTCEHFGIDERNVDIMMGTFTKVFGGIGGYVVGEKFLIDYLKIASKTYMLTAPLPPAICGGLIAAIGEIDRRGKELREKLWNNANYLRHELQVLGFDTLGSQTPIIPILVGGEKEVIKLSKALFERGIFAPYQHWPAVPKGRSRVRLTVMATHTREQINCLLETLNNILNKK